MEAIALNAADATSPVIEMQTEVGRLRGIWKGSVAVAKGESVDVELELPRSRMYEEVVFDPPDALMPGHIHGTVAAVFDDGVFVLRVGSSVVQVDLAGYSDADNLLGATIGLEASDLEFYPSGV